MTKKQEITNLFDNNSHIKEQIQGLVNRSASKVSNEFETCKILDTKDSRNDLNGYFNQIRSKNKFHIKKVKNGMENIDNLCLLQVNGINKLNKEISETKGL